MAQATKIDFYKWLYNLIESLEWKEDYTYTKAQVLAWLMTNIRTMEKANAHIRAKTSNKSIYFENLVLDVLKDTNKDSPMTAEDILSNSEELSMSRTPMGIVSLLRPLIEDEKIMKCKLGGKVHYYINSNYEKD